MHAFSVRFGAGNNNWWLCEKIPRPSVGHCNIKPQDPASHCHAISKRRHRHSKRAQLKPVLPWECCRVLRLHDNVMMVWCDDDAMVFRAATSSSRSLPNLPPPLPIPPPIPPLPILSIPLFPNSTNNSSTLAIPFNLTAHTVILHVRHTAPGAKLKCVENWDRGKSRWQRVHVRWVWMMLEEGWSAGTVSTMGVGISLALCLLPPALPSQQQTTINWVSSTLLVKINNNCNR